MLSSVVEHWNETTAAETKNKSTLFTSKHTRGAVNNNATKTAEKKRVIYRGTKQRTAAEPEKNKSTLDTSAANKTMPRLFASGS